MSSELAGHVDRCPLCGAWRYDQRCPNHQNSHPARTRATAEWPEQAVCRQVATAGYDPWYSDNYPEQLTAVQVCQGCPVRQPCLQAGMSEEWGVWGGWTANQRKQLRKQLPRNTEQAQHLLARAAALGAPALGITTTTKKG